MKIITVAVAAVLCCCSALSSFDSNAQTGKNYNSDTATHRSTKKPVKSRGKSSPQNRTGDTSRRNMTPGSTNMHNTMDEKRGNTSDSSR